MVKQALYVFKFEVQVFPKFHIYMISYKIYKNDMYEKSLLSIDTNLFTNHKVSLVSNM